MPFLANIERCPEFLEYALTIGFIIYKHFTHIKLYHPASGRSEVKLFTPRVTQENPEFSPTTSFLDQQQKQKKKKKKSWIHPASSFPLVTPEAKR